MTSPSSVAVALDLAEIEHRLGELAAGDANALCLLRPALQRVVVARGVSVRVKTLLVQAMLLLDDPRIVEGANGAPLLLKIHKLVSAALAAAPSGSGPLAGATPASHQARLEFSSSALLSLDFDLGLQAEFVLESREQLEVAEAALLVLDSTPDDLQALETLFRALHSIKGTSAFLGVEPATELAHHAETLLTRVRSGAATCTGELSNLIFRTIDMLDAMLVAIAPAANGAIAELPDGYSDLLALLRSGPSAEREHGSATRGNSGQFRRLLASDLSVRIRAVDVDRLADMAHELVLAHSMLARDASLRAGANPDFARKVAAVERLATELEELTTELRTVAFAATLQKLARLARDAAYQSGKGIELVLEGDDLLIERVMADALADPLMHMVRNAIDHGFESAEERLAAGKPAAGKLRIAAHRHGPELIIELGDDGRGLDPQELIRVAAERGLISPEARLGDREAFALLFRPGFTTATVVTDLSGRGVGMDVVRTNVDAIGGTIEIASRLGHGTTFTIRLPFRSRPARDAQHDWVDSERLIGLSA